MSWQGNINNTPPNPISLPPSVSGLIKGENRAFNTRRDTDTVKNVGTSLEDIDYTIMSHLNETINPYVVTEGNIRTKVPVIYGNPERWKSTQYDGVFKDYNGKIQLPIMMFTRESFAKNESLMTPNRHLKYPVMTKYTEKNKYDKFSVLNNTAVPVNTVYMITLPDHIKVTYKFMVWTELVEQLNHVIERVNFASEDYWGDKQRYRFRVYASDFSTPIEIVAGKDRVVRSECTLTVMGYLLPESFEDKAPTMQKLLTPRKVVITSEASYDAPCNIENSPSNIVIKDGYVQLASESPDLKTPPLVSNDEISTNTLQQVQSAYVTLVAGNLQPVNTNVNIWHPAPVNATDYGEDGWMAYDGNFHYIHVNGKWLRQPLTNFNSF